MVAVEPSSWPEVSAGGEIAAEPGVPSSVQWVFAAMAIACFSIVSRFPNRFSSDSCFIQARGLTFSAPEKRRR
jgi:hypothetical protein